MSNVPPPECVLGPGLIASGVVGKPVWDDDVAIKIAERSLHAKLRREFFAVDAAVNFKTWADRGERYGPAGEFHGIGWRLHFAVEPKFLTKRLMAVIDQLPNDYQLFELWCAPWPDETF
jgi:hypothetical protein